MLVLYSLLGVGFLGGGAWLLAAGEALLGGIMAVPGLMLLVVVFRSRDLSATSDIARAAVRRIEAFEPVPPATRGCFIVHFEEGGRMRRRYIILPGSLQNGAAEYENARAIFAVAGLLDAPVA